MTHLPISALPNLAGSVRRLRREGKPHCTLSVQRFAIPMIRLSRFLPTRRGIIRSAPAASPGLKLLMTSCPDGCLKTNVSPPALFLKSFAVVEVNVTPDVYAVMVYEPSLLSMVVETQCPYASITSCRAEYACPVIP